MELNVDLSFKQSLKFKKFEFSFEISENEILTAVENLLLLMMI